ncbi:hypothetical protein B566_EDAN001012 [Ephemera danica]|nr:hypothetical protein B566_EDAN001012 [Ephemera danica]
MNSSSAVVTSRHSRPPSKNTLLKVVILGDGGVGKSCLMNRFVNNHFDEHSFHTIGVEFLNKDIDINDETYTLQIWDTAGQERFKSLRTPFYRGSDVCLLTYAVDDKTSFENLILWKNEFLYYADVKDMGIGFPFLIVGNKVDVAPESREVSLEEALQWCEEQGLSLHIETSAKTAVNVENVFALAVDTWAKLEAKMERQYVGETVNLRKQPACTEQRTSCCIGQSYSDSSSIQSR